MRSALFNPTTWSPLAALLLLAVLLSPTSADESGKETEPAHKDPAPMAAGDNHPKTEITQAEVDAQEDFDKHNPEHPSTGEHAPEEFPPNPHDLSHNDPTEMQAAPHEPSISLAIFPLVVFVFLVWVLGHFAWSPIIEGLKARESSMEGKMKKAEEMYEQASAKLAEYNRKLAEAQKEIKQLREDMIKAADDKAKQIVDAAQQSAEAERQRAVREINAAKGAAINELAQASVNLAVDLAGQITRKELTAADHANLIQDSISKLPSSN